MEIDLSELQTYQRYKTWYRLQHSDLTKGKDKKWSAVEPLKPDTTHIFARVSVLSVCSCRVLLYVA